MFEEFLGPLEHVLRALTFLGVLYLVMKTAHLSLSLNKDGFRGNHGIRFLTVDDAGNRAGWYPTEHGYEGMRDQEHNLGSDSSAYTPKGYAKQSVEAMDSKLTSSMMGGNAALQ